MHSMGVGVGSHLQVYYYGNAQNTKHVHFAQVSYFANFPLLKLNGRIRCILRSLFFNMMSVHSLKYCTSGVRLRNSRE